jgi:hypothetical protein
VFTKPVSINFSTGSSELLPEAIASINQQVICTLAPAGSLPEAQRAHLLLDRVEMTFVDLCRVEQRLARFLRETSKTALEDEVDRLKASFTAERDLGVRFTLRQGVKLAERRLAHRERVTLSTRSLELKLDAIERALAYIRSQAISMGPTADFIREIEALAQQVGSAGAFEAEVSRALEASPSSREPALATEAIDVP